MKRKVTWLLKKKQTSKRNDKTCIRKRKRKKNEIALFMRKGMLNHTRYEKKQK